MSDYDDGEASCPVLGCPYTQPFPDDSAGGREAFFEQFEQHVRWIHVGPNDFGENPVPSITGLMLNGLIRPEEFGERLTGIATTALGEEPPPVLVRRWHALAVGGVRGVFLWGTAWAALVENAGLFDRIYTAVFMALGFTLSFYTSVLQNIIRRGRRVTHREMMVFAGDEIVTIEQEGEDDEPHL